MRIDECNIGYDFWLIFLNNVAEKAMISGLFFCIMWLNWLHNKQVAKWMLSKGQGATMGTYDTLLLAFDMDQRVDEADSLWNMILHTHTRSISKRLFSRMISLYDHHNMQDKIVEVRKILFDIKGRLLRENIIQKE